MGAIWRFVERAWVQMAIIDASMIWSSVMLLYLLPLPKDLV
jgi:hypothetical protein